MLADLTQERSHFLPRKKKTKLDSYMESILESPPATPTLQHALPVHMRSVSWPLVLAPAWQETRPTTPKLRHAQLAPPASYPVKQDAPSCAPMHELRRAPAVHKQPSPREKRDSPLKQSWLLPDSDTSSGENHQAQPAASRD
jgi:hypothetical protein